MSVYISLLRGINVSGHKKIEMTGLKAIFESLGFNNVTTYIQSGNIVFESNKKDVNELRTDIEAKIKKVFGYEINSVITTSNELKLIVENNPFKKDRNEDFAKLHLTLLSENPQKSLVEEIQEIHNNFDEFIIKNNVVYLFCPNGYGRTKFTNNFFEKKLKVSATTRT